MAQNSARQTQAVLYRLAAFALVRLAQELQSSVRRRVGMRRFVRPKLAQGRQQCGCRLKHISRIDFT